MAQKRQKWIQKHSLEPAGQNYPNCQAQIVQRVLAGMARMPLIVHRGGYPCPSLTLESR